MRKYYLIRNTAGLVYWSYKVGREAVSWVAPMYARAIRQNGDIFINRAGGWMPAGCVGKILRTVEQEDFPAADDMGTPTEA